MRQLQPKYSLEMLRLTKVAGLVLGIGGLVFLGGACAKTRTNTNIAVNSNAAVNSSISNGNENTNSSEIDTSDWQTYANEEYGFSFRYPKEWSLVIVEEGGLGKARGDVQLLKDECFIHIDKPSQASDDIMAAFTTGELRGSSAEVLSINGVSVLKQVGAVNTYGDIGDSYRILNGNAEVSLIVMQSGLDVEDCSKDYTGIVYSINKL